MNTVKTKSYELAVYARGDEKSSKLALILPGRLDSKDYIHNTSLVDLMADRGYYALSFDPPGTWESPGDIQNYSTTTYNNVINEVIEHFGNKPTLLLGHSRGGAVAMLASSNPAVSGIVAIMASYGPPSPPSKEAIQTGFNIEYRDLPPGAIKSKEQKRFELPIGYFKDGAQYNPMAALQKFNMAKLLIYGDEDEFTEPQRVEEIYLSLSEPKMIQKIHSVHDYRLQSEAVAEVNAIVGQFLDKHLS